MAYRFNPFTGKLDLEGPVLTGTGTVSAAADGTAALPGIAFASDLNTGIYRPGADQVAISTGGTGRLFVDASGKVGIGTTSPGVALHVDGDIRCDGVYGETDTNTSIQFPGSDVITFNEGGSEAARIDSSGRLLAGTSSAIGTVSGSTALTPFTPQFQFVGSASNQGVLIYRTGPFAANLYLASGSNGNAVSQDGGLGRIHFQGYSSAASAFRTAAWITCEVDGDPDTSGDTTDMPGRLVFSTTANGAATPTERVRITSDKSILVNGIYHLVESRSYTASTSATDVFTLTTTGTHGAATFKWMFVDTSFAEGARVGTIDLAWQRLNLTGGTTGINDTTSASASRGTFTGISWSVGSTGSNSITLAVTGTSASGSGTLYVWCESPYISKIVEA